MARVKNPVVVLGPDGRPLEGASVLTRVRSTSADAAVYSAETGGSTISATQLSDAQGNVPGWLPRGAYESVVSHESMEPLTVPWDAAPAGDGTIDEPWMGDASVAAASLVDALRPSQGAADADEALRALGAEAHKALPGDHASVTNARTPTAHATSHKSGGSDALYKVGVITGTTDGSANLNGSMAHGCGFTPSIVLVVHTTSQATSAPKLGWDATNLVYETGQHGAGPGATVSIYWIAFR